MRVLHLTHPDQVDELPAVFAQWVLAFYATEQEARAEVERREAANAG